jgi:PAT family beta-lactamase induction signal transducer AmpG
MRAARAAAQIAAARLRCARQNVQVSDDCSLRPKLSLYRLRDGALCHRANVRSAPRTRGQPGHRMTPRDGLGSVVGNRRIAAVLALGFSSGLPIALTSGTLQAWLATLDLNLRTIGAATLVGLPYTFKFLWAPLVDRVSLPWLGRRRDWILAMQLLLALVIAVTPQLDPRTDIQSVLALATLIAFLSATQDIAFDAYRTDVVHPEERGMGAAATVAGYRIAMLTSGALAPILSHSFGWTGAYSFVAAIMAACSIGTWLAPEPVRAVVPPRNLREAVLEPLAEFLGRPGIVAVLVLVVLYKLGDAMALSLSTAFIIKGLGFTAADVGTVSKGFGLGATILGAFFGGLAVAQIGLFRSLLWLGVAQAVTILPYAWLARVGHEYYALVVAIGVQNFGDGMGTAAFVALLTALCNVRFSAFQYALLSALASLGRILLGPVSGKVADSVGWVEFFLVAFCVALPGLALTLVLKREIDALDRRGAPA